MLVKYNWSKMECSYWSIMVNVVLVNKDQCDWLFNSMLIGQSSPLAAWSPCRQCSHCSQWKPQCPVPPWPSPWQTRSWLLDAGMACRVRPSRLEYNIIRAERSAAFESTLPVSFCNIPARFFLVASSIYALPGESPLGCSSLRRPG